MCINFVGVFFRIMTEIDIRKTFIERRECVQKNLMLRFERNQEVGMEFLSKSLQKLLKFIFSLESFTFKHFTRTHCREDGERHQKYD